MEYTFEIQVTNCAACVVNNYRCSQYWNPAICEIPICKHFIVDNMQRFSTRNTSQMWEVVSRLQFKMEGLL